MLPRLFRSYPSYNRAIPYIPAPFGLVGGLLSICGLIAIGSVFAPAILEQAMPGWRERLGVLVMIGVTLGFIRSIWRLFIPILGVLFWIVAVLCLWKPDIGGLSSYSLASTAARSQRYEQSRVRPAAISSHTPLPPALPDSAYFPQNSGSGALGATANSFIKRVSEWRS
jgi:hypothetical protein